MTSLKKKNTNENLLKAINTLGLDLTMEELGDKLGYQKATVSKYIGGRLAPSSEFLKKFEQVFKIDLDSFDVIEEKKETTQDNEWSALKQFNEHLKRENEFLRELLLKKQSGS